MMSVNYKQDRYNKMLDLQEKLRRSEQERIKLEEKCNQLIQESRYRHEACINRLRLRYIEFLEEQRVRDERNNKLRGALDRVDSSLAMIAAKTDRLNSLRKQYETHMLQMYGNHCVRTSTIGDSGIESQNEEKSPSVALQKVNKIEPSYKIVQEPSSHQTMQYPLLNRSIPQTLRISSLNDNETEFRFQRPFLDSIQSPGRTSVPISSYRTSRLQLSQPRFRESIVTSDSFRRYRDIEHLSPELEIPKSSFSRFDVPIKSKISPSHPGYLDYSISNIRQSLGRSEENTSRDIASFDMQRIAEKNKNLIPAVEPFSYVSSPFKYTSSTWKSSPSDYKPSSVTGRKSIAVLENELERYIDKIRKLHSDCELRSVDELEQNTSGDLLNETLSEDGSDFPIDGTKDRTNISKEQKEAPQNEEVFSNERAKARRTSQCDHPAGAVDEFTTRIDVPASETRHDVSSISQHGSSVAPVIDENNVPIAASDLEVVETQQNMEEITKFAEFEKEDEQSRSEETPKHLIQTDTSKETNLITENVKKNKDIKQEQDQSENGINESAETTDSWNPKNLLKDVQEMSLDEESSSVKKANDLECIDRSTLNSHVQEVDQPEVKIDENAISTTNHENAQNEESNPENVGGNNKPEKQYAEGYHYEGQEYVQDGQEQDYNQEYQDETNNYGYDSNAGYEQYERSEYNENVRDGVYEGDQYEQYQQNLNQQYESGEPYDQNQNQQYMTEEQYDQDPNLQYHEQQQNQQYDQDPNVQYTEQNESQHHGSNEQYEQDPNFQYDEQQQNQQYNQDPNMQYNEQDESQHYESNEQYNQDPNLQYSEQNANQEYESKGEYEYDPNLQYDEQGQNQDYNQDMNAQYEGDESYEYQRNTEELEDTKGISQSENQNLEREQEEMPDDSGSQKIEEENKIKATEQTKGKKKKDVIRAILDSDTESTIERNASTAESDFDFN